MNAITPVPAESLADHYQRAIAVRAKEDRRERRFGNAKTAAIVLLSGAVGWLAWNNGKLAEQAAAVPVIYTTLRDDGTLVNSARYTSLPARWQTDNTLNSLWWYVFWRECYSASEAARAHYGVQKMSNERVAREWREFFTERNPQSPQVVLGRRNSYQRCEPVSYAPIGRDGDRMSFRFERWTVDSRGNDGARTTMYASLAYRTGIFDPDPETGWKDRVTFNAPGIQVWEYPGAFAEGVQARRTR